ncbi:NodT family efflux transporter outer membrane factor (OMF) lipoprotein [Herbaspirillum rubrisubalbicans]|uniref:efflux transporter outer membrane subunit n=1 Tax=Herbaspirillum rubrisubalbicans TaxID=80842 RepID=UPI0020A2017A|nr:efflux transporter outer membrane subunit [Herbaspirillum rubrisubalbicans]MCP1572404.1 NodT family efflux transporter outer membrane factor (OMF) lipoprotein [Herbaspirillum rubrisubalbicans]
MSLRLSPSLPLRWRGLAGATALGLSFGLPLGGCAVGPDFKQPAAPQVSAYTAEHIEASQAIDGQRFVAGQDVAGQWWKAFGSPVLDSLVDDALAHNADLQAAQAALRAARETAAAQSGSLLPSVDLHFMPTRQKVADTLASPLADNSYIYNLHTAQLNIAYSPDIFGGTRRQIEAGQAQAEVQRFQRNATYLTLVSNVVLAVVNEAALREQLQAAEKAEALATQQLELVRQQRALGALGLADVAAQESLLAQAQAVLPGLRKQLAQQRDQIAVLVGRFPGQGGTPTLALSALKLPSELPLSLPSTLVQQRPDVRAAQAQWQAASAQVGVAIANRLPAFNITGTIGSSAQDISKLFTSGPGFWTLGLDLATPIFHGGSLQHQQRAAEAGLEQASAQYRSVVLGAFQNVADTLHAMAADADALKAAARAEDAAQRSFDAAQAQWKAGLAGYPQVLLAQQNLLTASQSRVQAQAGRLADTVALFQALGGGWWHQDL